MCAVGLLCCMVVMPLRGRKLWLAAKEYINKLANDQGPRDDLNDIPALSPGQGPRLSELVGSLYSWPEPAPTLTNCSCALKTVLGKGPELASFSLRGS